MKEICKARYEAFGSAGQANKITPRSLEAMSASYEAGELDAKVK
jgi:fructose-bisphosphate aldolase class II